MRVNVDSKALGDGRFKKLGRRLGINWFEAIGRCLPPWTAAYNARSPIMDAGDVDALAELAGFCDALIGAELAEAIPDGRVRLCGVEERIDFLVLQDAKREKARRAKLRAAGIDPDTMSPVVPGDGPAGGSRGTVPEGGSRRGAYSPDLDLDHALAPVAHAGAGAGAIHGAPAHAPAALGALVEANEHARARGLLADRTWNRMNEIRVALATENAWDDVQPLNHQLAGHRELRDRIREAGADAERQCDHVLTVLEAEARRDKSVQWLCGKSFSPKGWERALGMRLADVNRSRGGGPSARPDPSERPPLED